MEKSLDFKVVERIAVINGNSAGYTLELNKVSYHGNPAKLDLRKWKDGQPLKGVTLSDADASKLREALDKYHSLIEAAESLDLVEA